jgi:integrase/recombinase XerD
MKDSFSLRFYPYATKGETDKPKIYIRITVNRKKAELSTGLTVDPNYWDETKQRSSKDKKLNEELVFIENALMDIKRQLQYSHKTVSAKIIKDIYTGAHAVRKGVVECFEEYIEKMISLPQQYSKGTVIAYRSTCKHLKGFLEKNKVKDVLLEDVDYKFISDFDYFLLTVINPQHKRPMERNTANKQHQRLKTVLFSAMREGYLEKNPYKEHKLKNTKTNRAFLTEDELDLLKSHPLGDNASLQKVRDIFLFSVYSGLRFGDASGLKVTHIRKDKDGNFWIQKVQGKTAEQLNIPLLKPALEIVNKYDNEERKVTGYILPRISNQKVNTYLKTIAELVGIDKELTHHIARHTFATTVTLSNNVPIEIVSKMLGHTNIRTTQIYAKITNAYMTKIADQLNKKL